MNKIETEIYDINIKINTYIDVQIYKSKNDMYMIYIIIFNNI